MNRILVFGVLFLFIASSVTPISGFRTEQPVILAIGGSTLYVGGSGPNNYSTIQGAINDANDGDTVYVYNGSYYENIVINKSINLSGEDRDTTKIINWEPGYAVNISVDMVNISGFKISPSGFDDYRWGGITIGSCNNNISDNTFKGHQQSGETGIEISDFSNNTITGNIILNHETGIYLSRSNNNTIKNNYISGHWWSIDAHNSNNNTIENNYFPYSVHGICLQRNCNNNTISWNHLAETSCCRCIGIEYSSNNNTVSNNTLNSFGFNGVLIQSSRDNIVIGNMISDGLKGIRLWGSSNNIVACNTIMDCIEHGIKYTSKYTPLFNRHDIHRNYDICDNIYCNCILHNYHCKRHPYSSNNNTIYHNNFINNAQNALDLGNNVWDDGYPSGGNFWDDYNGTDEDGDGIGDIPYPIPGGDNEDRYPLMEPYGNWTIPPFARFTWTPSFPNPGEAILFNASESVDYDGNITLYEWDWDNDGEFDENHTNPTAPHIWSEYGYYPVVLRVTDNEDLADSVTKTVRVGNKPPEGNITGPRYGRPGVEYTFCVTSVDPDGDDLYCMWDWDDGTYSEWIGPYASGEEICVSHAWSDEGEYEIKVKFVDIYGGESDWLTHVIIIEAEPPELRMLSPKPGIYVNNRKVIPFLFPIIFGEITISVNASDRLSGTSHVNFYIDDVFKSNCTVSPYSFNWSERVFFRHTIKVEAYDNVGNKGTKEKKVWRFF